MRAEPGPGDDADEERSMATPPAAHETQREPIYRVIARHVRNDIAAGVLRSGQQLPSTRELALEWDVSVEPVNKAMALLAEEGLIINRDRSRRVVADSPSTELPNHVLRSKTPHVLLIGGYAGSGKTELGRILARRTGWPILDKDTLTRPVAESALELLGELPGDRESETYLTHVRPGEYEALRTAMTENVECGISVIVTAPFISEMGDKAWCDRTAAHLDSLGAKLHMVWVHCDEPTMHSYLKHRGAARDAWKLAHWNEYLASIDTSYRPIAEHHVVDNSAASPPIQQQAEQLLRAVQ